MTKRIRIENADNSDHKAIVEVWNIGIDGEPDTLADTLTLDHPTDMVTEIIYDTQYLVVKEVS